MSQAAIIDAEGTGRPSFAPTRWPVGGG
ncbi:MAG: hypothetical protein H6Q85_1224, partial [candidate division NC10 bacterium]|nr:hypothetical protein [candidate division NC10 bacterium]